MKSEIELSNWYQFTTEYEQQKLIDDLNSEYALVIVGGVAKILHRITTETGRDTYSYMTVTAFKLLLSNTKIEVNGVTKTYADYWMTHPNRNTFKNGVQYLPYRQAPKGVFNTWTGALIEGGNMNT
jgi:hypothetical protein